MSSSVAGVACRHPLAPLPLFYILKKKFFLQINISYNSDSVADPEFD